MSDFIDWSCPFVFTFFGLAIGITGTAIYNFRRTMDVVESWYDEHSDGDVHHVRVSGIPVALKEKDLDRETDKLRSEISKLTIERNALRRLIRSDMK